MKRCGGAGLVGLLGLVASACLSSAQEPLELEIEARGTAASRVSLRDRGELELSRADLAFGPLTLCPGSQAGSLCDTARMEWLETARVDALAPERQSLGRLRGMSGPVLSYMYDLGVVSLLGEPGSRYTSSTVGEQGGSLVLEGVTLLDGRSIPFTAHVLVQSEEDGEQGLPVVRKSSSEHFEHELSSADAALVVHFDASAWVRGLSSTDFVQVAACTSGGAATLCQEDIELTCDEAGQELSRRDCRGGGELCAPNHGCAEKVEILHESAAYRTLVQALTAGERPLFEFR